MKRGKCFPLQWRFAAAILLGTVYVSPVTALPSAAERWQERTLSGTVKDEKGTPLPGVTVRVEGTGIGASTDAGGKFVLRQVPANAVVSVSFLGYVTQKISPGAQSSMNIVMKEDVAQLEQVVVVGYGTQKRSDITGSVTSIPKERLSKLPVTNVTQAMQGAVAGLNITSDKGRPGETGSIYIRGLNSITASTAPLVVLDGVPFSGSYNDINSGDIESIEVLKDASATAIYGTRGTNGVILITTKRGKTGKPAIRYNGYAGTEYMAHMLRPMNGAAYVQKNIDWARQAGKEQRPVFNKSEIPNYEAGRETNWMNEISQQGYIHNHDLSVSGGTDNVKYYIGGSYLKQQGVLKGYQYTRASVRSNLDIRATDWLKLGADLLYVYNNTDGGRADLGMASAMSPYGSVYNQQGGYEIYPMDPETLYSNPLIELYRTARRRNKNISGNFYTEVQPAFLRGLKYRLNFNAASRPSELSEYSGRKTGDMQGTGSIQLNNRNNWILENILSYDKSWKKHSLNVTALYSGQYDQQPPDNLYSYELRGVNFINDQLEFNDLKGAQLQTVKSAIQEYRIVSQMMRLNYSYDSRYLLTLTARRDGYSGFGANNKYGLFPSMAVGWNIASEPFLKDVSWISMLKLRASYGTTGNMGVSPYRTLNSYKTVTYIYDNTTAIGLQADRMSNPNLKWESTTSANIGVDFDFLKGRIGGTVEVYTSKTRDLLLNRTIPVLNGYSAILDNIGKTKNRGIEITLNTRNVVTRNFTWSSNLNISMNHNEIVSLYGDTKNDIGNKWFIGKPLKAVYDYRLVGIWQEGDDFSLNPKAKPGDLKFADINGDKVFNNQDREYLGTGLPDYIFGFTNTFSWKQFTLNIFIQGVQGVYKNNYMLDNRDQAGRINLPATLGYWTKENRNNERPGLAYNNIGYGYPQDASYWRVKDVSLSYNFRPEQLKRLHIPALSLYVSGRNLATVTKWFGWDPEINQGVNDPLYPALRSVVAGVNITL